MGTSVRMLDLTYGHLVRGSEAVARDRLDVFTAQVAIFWAKSRPRDQLPIGSPKHETPALAGVSVDGRYWARTSDPQLVELVLSQLS
jgi:hypothetical protein